VYEAVSEELAGIVAFEHNDPRLAAVDVIDVQVGRDLRHAHVKVGIREDAEAERRSLAALEHARPFLRRELARRLDLRRIPELHFQVDRFPEAESRVEVLLKRARKTRGRGADESGPPGPSGVASRHPEGRQETPPTQKNLDEPPDPSLE
jgi:ribosome-binding factor A